MSKNTVLYRDADQKNQTDDDSFSQETADALQESERIANDPSIKGYTNITELLAELKK